MTAYLITTDESTLDNEATSFSRAITETIKFEPGVCWVFQRHRSEVRLIAVGYGVPRPRRVSTAQRVVKVTCLERVDEAVDLEEILAAVQERPFPPTVDRAPRTTPRWGGDHAEAVERGCASVMGSTVQQLRQDVAEILARVE